ncbi:hypothetical protein Bca101_043447 [Brassica carinata]
MSDEPRRQTTAAMVRNLASNSTTSCPEKLTTSIVVDLGESSNMSQTSKSRRKQNKTTIDEEVADTDDELEQEKSDQERDMQSHVDEENTDERESLNIGGQYEVAPDSEEEEPELMEQDEDEPEFVYEELEQRVEILRAQHQAPLDAIPTLRNLKRRPFNAVFHTKAASIRFEHLSSRTVLIQKYLPDVDSDLLEGRKIIEKAHLMYTVMDIPNFTLEVVLELYANLGNMIKRDGTTWVYVRSHMYEFSPAIINSVFKTPSQDANFPRKPWTTEKLDDAASTITGGKKKKWGNLKMLDVTPTMNILFKFCVVNWMPTSNRSTLTIDRFKFIHMITDGSAFDFGKMVFDQIYELGQQAISGETNKLLFPNLIRTFSILSIRPRHTVRIRLLKDQTRWYWTRNRGCLRIQRVLVLLDATP